LFCVVFLILIVGFTQQIEVKLKESKSVGVFNFEILNDESEIYTFLIYNTPFEGIFADMFEVTSRDGEIMSYMGPVARRVIPAPPSAYIHLYPANSLSVEVNISKYYEITASGIFKIVSKVLLFEEVAANEAELFLHENGENFGFSTVMPNTYTNCNPTEQNQVASATSTAITQSTRAYNCMSANSCSSLATTWFGAYNANNYNYDQTCFNNIKNTLNSRGINAYCNPAGCGANVYAYVYPNDPQQMVYLCGAFWSQPLERPNTIVHEMSHFTVIAGTQDYAYGRTPCRNLANNNPYQASHNADNVCYFSDDA